MPLEEIGALCTQYDCLFFVDAIKLAEPHLLTLNHSTDFSTGGHKWLMGVEGTACTYIRKKTSSPTASFRQLVVSSRWTLLPLKGRASPIARSKKMHPFWKEAWPMPLDFRTGCSDQYPFETRC